MSRIIKFCQYVQTGKGAAYCGRRSSARTYRKVIIKTTNERHNERLRPQLLRKRTTTSRHRCTISLHCGRRIQNRGNLFTRGNSSLATLCTLRTCSPCRLIGVGRLCWLRPCWLRPYSRLFPTRTTIKQATEMQPTPADIYARGPTSETTAGYIRIHTPQFR